MVCDPDIDPQAMLGSKTSSNLERQLPQIYQFFTAVYRRCSSAPKWWSLDTIARVSSSR